MSNKILASQPDDYYIKTKLDTTVRILKSGRVFQLTIQDIKNQMAKQQGLCYYTKIPIQYEYGFDNSFSIDRVNSELGYTIDNIVLTIKDINVMKAWFPVSRFVELCKLVGENEDLINKPY